MQQMVEYETVIGLEVHAQLLTKSKLFCADDVAYGAPPNTHISNISLAHPGVLPKLNQQAIEHAIRMGLACNCKISPKNYFARKNYFYPDLPKGYQISQHTTPICIGGYVEILINGVEKKIALTRIHLEEDAGKSIHVNNINETKLDFNRAGTALIEIVSEPVMHTAEEAFLYLTEIRKIVRYLNICDGNMEEGSLRCDANISVRIKGDEKLGVRVEVKNVNSLRHLKKAIEFEAKRLQQLHIENLPILQQTRSYDESTNTTIAIRSKEEADDYRYFPEPDLPMFNISYEWINEIKNNLPQLPKQRIEKYKTQFNFNENEAIALTDDKFFSDYFDKLINEISVSDTESVSIIQQAHIASNWMLGPVKNWINENHADITKFPLSVQSLHQIIILVKQNKISFSQASNVLFQLACKNPHIHIHQLLLQNNLLQQSDIENLLPIIDQVLAKFPDKVLAYKKGKKGLLALFVGEVMKLSKGTANPSKTNELLIQKLK